MSYSINLEGRVALVTGGSNGMGLEITRALVSAGASVVVPARNLDKAGTALKGIERVELVPLDLMDAASIKATARRESRPSPSWAMYPAHFASTSLMITSPGWNVRNAGIRL